MFGVACWVTARSPAVTIPPLGAMSEPIARRITSPSMVVPSMTNGGLSKATGFSVHLIASHRKLWLKLVPGVPVV